MILPAGLFFIGFFTTHTPNNLFTVECEDEVIRNCTIKGKVIKTDKEFYNPIAPGDVVEIEPDSLNDEKGQIISLEN